MKKLSGWALASCVCIAGLYLAQKNSPITYAAPESQQTPQPVAQRPPPASQPIRSSASRTASNPPKDAFETAVKPLISGSCGHCHNSTQLEAGLDLTRFLPLSSADALKQRDILQLVLQKLQAGEMPPPGEPMPPAERIAAATQWIQQQLTAFDNGAPENPGRVTVHRLNRYEYNNTVRDLLDINLRFADDFPPDPYGYGFDNIGDVLTLSPLLTEKYLKAAERVAKAAIPLGPPEKGLSVRYESQALGQQFHTHVQTTHDFPAEGFYNLRVGWEQGYFKGTTLTGHIYLDGKEVLNVPIVINPTQDRAIYAKNLHITQGPHLFEAWLESGPNFKKQPPPYPTVLEIFGPSNPVPREQTASYKHIFFKGPPPAGAAARAEYTRLILTRLTHRAYRRPVSKPELDHLMTLTRLVRSHGGSFEESIQVALEAVLMSPNFLFRIEQDPAGEAPHRVSDEELASRLSYFLWSSMPDDELLATAEKGRLHDPEVLHAEVARMVADPKAHALASNFAGQWLQTRNLEFQSPDQKAFPTYDVQLRDSMRTETEMFFQSVVSEDRSVLDFIDGKFTFVNDRLAALYGIPGITGREFRRVSLDGTERSGVITQASVLTASSYPTRTSPVIRGKWVLESILNTTPPPPPPNVPALDTKDIGTSASVRQRLEQHRANPACAGCHSRMDPLGFGLDNYDAIGRWRTTDGQLPIDSSGLLPDGRTFSGAAQLKAILLTDSPRFVSGLSEKLLIYALGRGIEPYDKPAVDKIAKRVENNGYRFSQLLLGVVDSAPFQMREREPSLPSDSEKVAAGSSRASHPIAGRSKPL